MTIDGLFERSRDRQRTHAERTATNMPRPRKNPNAVIEDAFYALTLEEQAATLRILAYIHRRAVEDAEIKKATVPE